MRYQYSFRPAYLGAGRGEDSTLVHLGCLFFTHDLHLLVGGQRHRLRSKYCPYEALYIPWLRYVHEGTTEVTPNASKLSHLGGGGIFVFYGCKFHEKPHVGIIYTHVDISEDTNMLQFDETLMFEMGLAQSVNNVLRWCQPQCCVIVSVYDGYRSDDRRRFHYRNFATAKEMDPLK